MRFLNRAGWIILVIWVGAWIYFSRYAMLDDALIHLRYAAFLQKLHFVTYDGIHHTYGTSSLLYLSILAFLRSFTTSALLPKTVSVICYLFLIFVLSILRRRSVTGSPSWLLWLALLFTALTPMSIRWLTDGMETGLVVLSATLLAWFVHSEGTRKSPTVPSYLFALLFGALLVCLRIELISLAFAAACTIVATRLQQTQSRRSAMRMALHGTALAAGALLAILATRLAFGSFLPDTALAKSGITVYGTLGTAAMAIVSSADLGIGTAMLALLSGLFLLVKLIDRKAPKLEFLAWACTNGIFPLLIVLACARGQIVQGIRYLLWPLFFAIAWNALELNQARNRTTSKEGLVRYAAWAYALLLLALLPFDWYFAERVMAGRENTFLAMRAAHLGQFQGEQLIAGDVGFIGYFTGANVCDMAGLVDGRDAARLTQPRRNQRCASLHPQLLFVNADQASDINRSTSLKDWIVCQRMDFTNVRYIDPHYLMVPGTAGAQACPDGSNPTPVGKVIPKLAR